MRKFRDLRYKSERFMQEIVLAMGEAVLEPIKEEIQLLLYFPFSLMKQRIFQLSNR